MLKLQFRRMVHSKSFALTVTFTFILLMAGAILTIMPDYGAARNSLYPAWQYCYLRNSAINVTALYITTLMPLSCALLHSAAYLDDRSALTADVLFTRGGKVRYWGAGIFLSFISPFLLTLLALSLCRGLIYLAFPMDSMILFPNYPSRGAERMLTGTILFWKDLAATRPCLYLFVYDLLAASYAGLVAVAAYALGMLLHRRVLAVFLPGLMVLALDYALSFSEMHVWSLSNSLLPGNGGRELIHLVAAFAFILAVDAVLLAAGFMKNRDVLPEGQSGGA